MYVFLHVHVVCVYLCMYVYTTVVSMPHDVCMYVFMYVHVCMQWLSDAACTQYSVVDMSSRCMSHAHVMCECMCAFAIGCTFSRQLRLLKMYWLSNAS